jgi:hypothetical protein
MGDYMTTSAIHPYDGYCPHENSDGSVTLFDMQGNVGKILYSGPSGLEIKLDQSIRKDLPKEDKKYSGNVAYF